MSDDGPAVSAPAGPTRMGSARPTRRTICGSTAGKTVGARVLSAGFHQRTVPRRCGPSPSSTTRCSGPTWSWWASAPTQARRPRPVRGQPRTCFRLLSDPDRRCTAVCGKHGRVPPPRRCTWSGPTGKVPYRNLRFNALDPKHYADLGAAVGGRVPADPLMLRVEPRCVEPASALRRPRGCRRRPTAGPERRRTPGVWRLDGLRARVLHPVSDGPGLRDVLGRPAQRLSRGPGIRGRQPAPFRSRAWCRAGPSSAAWSPSRLCFYGLDTVQTPSTRSDRSGQHPQLPRLWTVLAAGLGRRRGTSRSLFANSERSSARPARAGQQLREVRGRWARCRPKTRTASRAPTIASGEAGRDHHHLGRPPRRRAAPRTRAWASSGWRRGHGSVGTGKCSRSPRRVAAMVRALKDGKSVREGALARLADPLRGPRIPGGRKGDLATA